MSLSELYFSLYSSRSCPHDYAVYAHNLNGILTIDSDLVAITASAAAIVLRGNGLDSLVDAAADAVGTVDERRSDELDAVWVYEASVALVRIGRAARGASENSLVALFDLAVSVGLLVGLTSTGSETWEESKHTTTAFDVAQAWEILKNL